MKGLSALRLWALRLEPILIRLFDRADQLALDIASGRQQVDSADETVLKKMGVNALTALIVGVAILGGLWQV